MRYILIALMMVSCVSFAESLKDKKDRKEAMDGIQGQIDSMNTACGAKISVNVDFGSFSKVLNPGVGHDVSAAANMCGNVVDGTRQVCESGADEKTAVAKSVKKISCKFKAGVSTDAFPKSALNLSGGNLSAAFDWDTANIPDGVKSYITTKL